ncbi:adenomatous polyposis coli protein [Caerostris extrusa]|uniref:Adenomatous polyposis coli protein n=1 Tax=Caerostris extrusa TaxID=172846 RepID=A0AAV4QFF0_CAEEX|nr:adenomatous polyposis coli protein [Caerostris extrusa]
MSNNELAESTKHSEPQESYRASVDPESALPADEPVNFVDKPLAEEAPEDILKAEEEEEAAEKDIDCSESEEVMLTSSLLGEAREIAQLLAAGSTEDMTVSTLSCLSDIDNARPPSAMGELHCLSADDSIRTTQLLGKQLSSKKSLLRELQLGRLASSTDSPDNLSLRSSCTSDLLANKDSLSERMHEAAAMAQMCARELSAITGGGAEKREERGQIRIPVAVQQQEVTIADVTDIGWGSDTEVEEDLPCDDEETLRAVTRDEGSSENLTFTLTEEQPRPLMTSEEFRALQENAHRVLRTLRDAEVSDDDDDGGHSGDLLDDETMSLVSNGSDEESPKASPTCNNGLPRPKATTTFPTPWTRGPSRARGPACLERWCPPSGAPPPKCRGHWCRAKWRGRPLQRNEDRNGSSPRSTPSPKSPLSRSGTFERLSDAETSPTPAIRRPSSLAIANRTRSAPSQKQANDRPRPSILSPSGGIPGRPPASQHHEGP